MKFRRSVLAMLTAFLLTLSGTAWAGNGQNLLQHVPSSSNIVVTVNLEALRASPIYQMLWGMVSGQPEVQEALTQMQTMAGFDPTTDLSTMLISLSGDDEKFAVLIEGNYNVEQITAALTTLSEGQTASMEYQGYTVYHDPSETAADKAYFCFVNNGLLAIGTQDELGGVLDVIGGGAANVTTNASVSGLISQIDTSGVFWFAGALPAEMQAELVGSPMAGMSTVRGGGNLTGGLNVNYVLGSTDEQQATAMAGFLQTGLAQARTQPEVAQMGLTGILDGVTISNSGTDVSIAVAVPEQTLNQIFGMLAAIMAAEGMGAPQ